jgi:hypothetical protein
LTSVGLDFGLLLVPLYYLLGKTHTAKKFLCIIVWIKFVYYSILHWVSERKLFVQTTEATPKSKKQNVQAKTKIIHKKTIGAFLAMSIPWAILEMPHMIYHLRNSEVDGGLFNLFTLFLMDGLCHFGQNLCAFSFMTMVVCKKDKSLNRKTHLLQMFSNQEKQEIRPILDIFFFFP